MGQNFKEGLGVVALQPQKLYVAIVKTPISNILQYFECNVRNFLTIYVVGGVVGANLKGM